MKSIRLTMSSGWVKTLRHQINRIIRTKPLKDTYIRSLPNPQSDSLPLTSKARTSRPTMIPNNQPSAADPVHPFAASQAE